MGGPLCVVDTNVLVNWVKARARAKDDMRKSCARSRRFCESAKHEIYVPGVVLVELYGTFLQRDIDLADYQRWYRHRRSALQALEQKMFGGCRHISMGGTTFDDTLAITLSSHPIPGDLRSELEELNNQRRPVYRDRGWAPPVNKLLDGIDAAILATAWTLAALEPNRDVVLVSWDKALRMAAEHLRGETIGSRVCPTNLMARVPSLLPSQHRQ